ncbi:unnamed protein product [Chondrus crispus]|uniref:Uncharacterized protein n=1 Tax=Chondrus crispus TaxID=2769 RepID=R7QGA5_CHOCR|nr:unnamed protein product [Chondrus crispus]CDF36813.1 unnamed protein product [Chondrus crispus]|eukprot:XP_005716632.1 unnamed protein product [Chondrus crispus]
MKNCSKNILWNSNKPCGITFHHVQNSSKC